MRAVNVAPEDAQDRARWRKATKANPATEREHR